MIRKLPVLGILEYLRYSKMPKTGNLLVTRTMPLHKGTPYYQNTPSSTFTPFAYTRTASYGFGSFNLGMHVPFSGARGDFIQSQFVELNQRFNNHNPTFPLEKVVVNNLTSSLWKQSYFVIGLQLKEEFSDGGSYKETWMRSTGLLRFDG